jgi:hypothetical protein
MKIFNDSHGRREKCPEFTRGWINKKRRKKDRKGERERERER